MKQIKADVAILGGGFGGVAACLALLAKGRSVVMIERYPWIGGQVTSQALCVLDDLHDPTGETTGVSRSYAEFRRRVRDAYREAYPLSAFGAAQLYLNPGNALCSHLAAEPHIAHHVLKDWMKGCQQRNDQLRVLTGYAIERFLRDDDMILSCQVTPVTPEQGQALDIEAAFFLDATETGETYPRLNLPFRVGSEARSEFDEPHAPETADPCALQSLTYCVAVEFVAGGNYRIAKPENYEKIRDRQNFYLYSPGATPAKPARFFESIETADGHRVVPFWFYRSVLDPRNFAQPDLRPRAILNVPGNDYHDAPFLSYSGDATTLADAHTLARCFLYWLQTEVPRDDGGRGYPEIRSLPEITGTDDGIAMAPYIREGRRLVACTTVTERDIHADFCAGSRARHWPDSVGLGGYFMDLHRTTGGTTGLWEPARPYQIPLGALVTPALRNFAVANKGIGVTQIANGAYRLHPVEWAIGEAAGTLADYAIRHPSKHPHLNGSALREFQRELAEQGVPLYWYTDVPNDMQGFSSIQMMATEGIWGGSPAHLRCDPHESLVLHRAEFLAALKRLPATQDLETARDVYLTAHNVRKHDAICVLDSLRP